MKIDKPLLEKQLTTLRAQQEEAIATVNAASGGIQVIEHLLDVLKMKKPREEVPELKDLLPPGTEIVEPEVNDGAKSKSR